jgi:beta-1,2-mannobiose phosphorylase / 1,2-beta-oligomannan phosphorylase
MVVELASGFSIERLGVMMRPDPTRAEEIEGVLNPAAVRAPDGELYLFPRLGACRALRA